MNNEKKTPIGEVIIRNNPTGYGLFAGIGVGRADISDPVGIRRIGVGGEQRHLAADAVECIGRGFRIDGADHDGGDAGGHEVVHQPLLHGGGGLFGIFE